MDAYIAFSLFSPRGIEGDVSGLFLCDGRVYCWRCCVSSALQDVIRVILSGCRAPAINLWRFPSVCFKRSWWGKGTFNMAESGSNFCGYSVKGEDVLLKRNFKKISVSFRTKNKNAFLLIIIRKCRCFAFISMSFYFLKWEFFH